MQVLGLQTPVPRWPGKPTHMYDTLEDRCKKTICLTAALHITHASRYTSINCPQHTCSPNACMILWKMSTHSYTLFAMSKTKKTVWIYIYACMHIIYTYTYTNTYVQMHILYLPSLACSFFIHLNTSSLTKATVPVIQNKWYKVSLSLRSSPALTRRPGFPSGLVFKRPPRLRGSRSSVLSSVRSGTWPAEDTQVPRERYLKVEVFGLFFFTVLFLCLFLKKFFNIEIVGKAYCFSFWCLFVGLHFFLSVRIFCQLYGLDDDK